MAHFIYKAKSGPNDVISGFIDAESVADAVTRLTNAGQMPFDVKLHEKMVLPQSSKSTGVDISVSRAALFQFTRQLADLLDAGIPLARSMELLSRQRQFPVMVGVIESMTVLLQQGGSLSFALAKYPGIFSTLYIHTVKAAEASGKLPLVLNRLAQFLENDMQIQSKAKASLLYPVIILVVGLLTLFVLLSFVLPRLTMMFEDFDAQLPLVTRMVVAVSGVFAQFWWLMAAVITIVILWIRSYLKTGQGKAWIDGFSLRIPLLKSYIENTQLSRFSRTLGMLLESGVPIVPALESVTMVVDNHALQEEVKKIALRVKAGMSLTQAIKASTLFPEMAVDLIAVGQESGKLERGLYKLAASCERASQDMAGAFVTILGPAVLVVVVSIVGFMIVAMLLPMFQMNMIIN
ncbi:MAG: type II secretion system F family protein [Candidatus Omnitrophica bacterium]|nr:type II secretion system F family protein [Candidatus Omnitrophota bacterium]